MTDDCIHGLGPVAACVICNGRAKRQAAESVEEWRFFAAKYEGQCAECDLPILVGQRIAWKPDTQPRHEECADA